MRTGQTALCASISHNTSFIEYLAHRCYPWKLVSRPTAPLARLRFLAEGSKMTRNLKALGLALIATFAMSAVAASSASALGEFTSTSGPYPKHLVVEDVGAADVFTVGGSEAFACHNETHTLKLTGPVKTIEAAPEFGETCQVVGSAHWNQTPTENDCKLHFEWESNVATDHDKVKVKVVCPPLKAIEIHRYNDSTPHGSSFCTSTVGSQTASGTLTATSETGSGDILLEGTVGLTYQTHGACSFNFTLNPAAEFIASTTVRDTAGTRIHIG
jgi:hypothetical protein